MLHHTEACVKITAARALGDIFIIFRDKHWDIVFTALIVFYSVPLNFCFWILWLVMRLSEFKQNMLVNIFAFLLKLAANEFSELFFDRFVLFYSNLFIASFQNKLHRKPAAKFRLFTLVRNFQTSTVSI